MKRFTKKNDMITDTSTGKTWKIWHDHDTTWKESNQIAREFDKGRWRLPTRQEVSEIMVGSNDRHLPSVFDTTGWLVWTNQEAASSSRSAFRYGVVLGGGLWDRRCRGVGDRCFLVKKRKLTTINFGVIGIPIGYRVVKENDEYYTEKKVERKWVTIYGPSRNRYECRRKAKE